MFSMPKTRSLANLAKALDTAIQVLNFIAKTTKTVADDNAATALAAIRAALVAAEKGVEGKIDPARIRDALAELTTAIAANDKAAADRLRAKFKVP